jgi:hypothetical protein
LLSFFDLSKVVPNMAGLKSEIDKDMAAAGLKLRADYDALNLAAEKAAEATRRSISAIFIWTPRDAAHGQSTETRDIEMRIIHRGDRDLLQLIGGPTGHEVYRVDALAKHLIETIEKRDGVFLVCAGAPGLYASCRVNARDILSYIAEKRPDLSPEGEFRVTRDTRRNISAVDMVNHRDCTAEMSIERAIYGDCEVVRFRGGPIGDESYALTGKSISLLLETSDLGYRSIAIRGGAGGQYKSLAVSGAEVISYIAEMRPHLIPKRLIQAHSGEPTQPPSP